MPRNVRKTSAKKAAVKKQARIRPFTGEPVRLLTGDASELWFDIPALEEEVGRRVETSIRVMDAAAKFMRYLDEAHYGYTRDMIRAQRRRDREAFREADEKRWETARAAAEMLRQPHPRTLAVWAVQNYDRIVSLFPESEREGAARALEDTYVFYTLKT